jgi:DNA segregation ATPase FtsK/SpoIIIE-like protein
MTAAHEIQLRAGHHLAPGPQEAFRIAAEASAAAQAVAQANGVQANGVRPNGVRPNGAARPPGYYGARLWERRADDPDFGHLRLGVGTMPSNVVYSFKGAKNMSSPLARDAQRLEADSRFVLDAPVTIALRPDPHAGLVDDQAAAPRHALAVFGPQPTLTYSFIAALLVQYAAFHAPTDARLYILAPQEAQNAWRWALRLPHVTPSGPGQTVCFEDARDRQGEKDQNKLAIFLRWRSAACA